MLAYTQLLILELGATCNYAEKHPLCPVSKRTLSIKNLTDEKIIELVKEAYNDLNFTGFIAWHFYNEPMLKWKRMLSLMEKIRQEVFKSRFLLWTNGSIVVEDPRFDLFEKVIVTDYDKRGEKYYKKYYKNYLSVNPENFDNRLSYTGDVSYQACLRPFTEFIISYSGEVYLCCQDWENRVKVGNVFDKSLKELDNTRTELMKNICKKMNINTPETCLRCQGRFGLNTFDVNIAYKTMAYLANLK